MVEMVELAVILDGRLGKHSVERVRYVTGRSVEHCTPHADGAWLNELGWSQYNSCIYMVKLRNCFFRKQNSTQTSTM